MLENIKDNLPDLNPMEAVGQTVEQTKAKASGIWAQLKSMGMPAVAIVVLGGLTSYFFPWWSVVVVAALVGFYFNESPMRSYSIGLLAVTMLWSGYAGYLSNANGGILAGRVAALLGGVVSGTQLIWATGFLGGIVGGFGALTGSLARKAFWDK